MSVELDWSPLETVLGHCFLNQELLKRALCHRSYANENGLKDNERLEFLGDAVLDLLIGHDLMLTFAHLNEGQLSMARAEMVSESALYIVAKELEIGDWLLLGRGEDLSGGRKKASILSDTVEAIIGAIYLDAGLEAARAFVNKAFVSLKPKNPESNTDYKTQLQQLAHQYWKLSPDYKLIAESGPDHNKRFEIAVCINDVEKARATGSSKKSAEQEAAKIALASSIRVSSEP